MRASEAQVQQLLGVLEPFGTISARARTFLAAHLEPKPIKQRRCLIKKGEACSSVYFIESGLIRGFYGASNGKQVTTWISRENELITSIGALSNIVISDEYIQALEDSRLLALSLNHLEELYLIESGFNIVIRKLMQRYYFEAERRARIARLPMAAQRYEMFINEYSYLANRVPVTYVASFLGIRLETLSRIRSERLKKVANDGL